MQCLALALLRRERLGTGLLGLDIRKLLFRDIGCHAAYSQGPAVFIEEATPGVAQPADSPRRVNHAIFFLVVAFSRHTVLQGGAQPCSAHRERRVR